MISKLYSKFLWFWGFKVDSDPDVTGDEKITYMLRRQKARLKWFWWPWAVMWILIPIWLFLHILQIGGF